MLQEQCISGVKPELKGTIISQIYDLRTKYNSEFKITHDEIESKKDRIREEFKIKLEKVDLTKKRYTKKYKQELYAERKKQRILHW